MHLEVSMIVIMTAPQLPRLRVRRCDPDLAYLSERARREGWLFNAYNGGTVANAYGYTAETEVVIAIANPDGLVAAWWGRAPANKVTERACAVNALPWPRQCSRPEDWWDDRCGTERRARALHALKMLWAQAYPAHAEPTTCLWCVVEPFRRIR
jgi:hypothetical protein